MQFVCVDSSTSQHSTAQNKKQKARQAVKLPLHFQGFKENN
jgi:hypothetical protein